MTARAHCCEDIEEGIYGEGRGVGLKGGSYRGARVRTKERESVDQARRFLAFAAKPSDSAFLCASC